jgi:hypothetical protein
MRFIAMMQYSIIRSRENESVAGDKSSFHGPLSRTKSGSTLDASWAQMISGSQNMCLHMMANRRTWSALWNFMADKWPMKPNTSVMRSSRLPSRAQWVEPMR